MPKSNYDSLLRALAVVAKKAGSALQDFSVASSRIRSARDFGALERLTASLCSKRGRIPGSLRTKRLRKKRNKALLTADSYNPYRG